MQTKYIPQTAADYILKVLNVTKQEYPHIWFKVIDSVEGDVIYEGSNPEKALEEMDGIDADFGVNCYINYNCCGWFFLTPYEEEGCVLCDYSDNSFCMEIAENLTTII